jgi:hypothetical protein
MQATAWLAGCFLTGGTVSLEGAAGAKLQQTDPQADGLTTHLGHSADVAHCAGKLRLITGMAKWTHRLGLALVNGLESAAAQLERVVLVVLQLVLVCRIFVARLKSTKLIC